MSAWGSSRVEDERGGLRPVASAPFPIPAHRTGRADLRHPALRLASSQGLRLCAVVREPEVIDANVAVHGLDGEPSRAAPAQLMAPPQELANSREDMIVNCSICRPSCAVTKVSGPATQDAVQLFSHLGPWGSVGSAKQRGDLVLESRNAFLRRARAQILLASLPAPVRTERITKEVELLGPGIPHRGLRLVESEPELSHHHLRPRQRL